MIADVSGTRPLVVSCVPPLCAFEDLQIGNTICIRHVLQLQEVPLVLRDARARPSLSAGDNGVHDSSQTSTASLSTPAERGESVID
jgi:hypothetical protein